MGVVGSLSEVVLVCICVCLSVMGLWLKYTSFIFAYIPHCHVCTRWQQARTGGPFTKTVNDRENTQDDRRLVR